MNQPLSIAVVCCLALGLVGVLLPSRLAPSAPAVRRVDVGSEATGTRAFAGGASVTLDADAAGHYHGDVEIEGRRLRMMVDTGATYVALRAEDASSAGIDPMPADYTVSVSTVNGTTTVAKVRIRQLRIGSIVAWDVPAVVVRPGLLGESLLGMSFLQTVGHVEIGERQLVLKP